MSSFTFVTFRTLQSWDSHQSRWSREPLWSKVSWLALIKVIKKHLFRNSWDAWSSAAAQLPCSGVNLFRRNETQNLFYSSRPDTLMKVDTTQRNSNKVITLFRNERLNQYLLHSMLLYEKGVFSGISRMTSQERFSVVWDIISYTPSS